VYDVSKGPKSLAHLVCEHVEIQAVLVVPSGHAYDRTTVNSNLMSLLDERLQFKFTPMWLVIVGPGHYYLIYKRSGRYWCLTIGFNYVSITSGVKQITNQKAENCGPRGTCRVGKRGRRQVTPVNPC
jgi:hypothetical protein